MKFTPTLLTTALAVTTEAAILWDGRFNDFSSSSDLNKWSWSNQVGPYQYYIHGSGAVTKYINLSPDFKNPNDTVSRQGAKFTLDSTAYWNGQNMRRIELIPQTKAAINRGKLFYHFSISRKDTNAPSVNKEHQICFFESHFTELKYGWISGEQGTANANLQWMTNQKSQWKVEWKAGVWHNFAYEIACLFSLLPPFLPLANREQKDFGANRVGLWHSEGGDPLKQVVAPVSGVSTSSNGADWHLGVLELPRSGYATTNEDYYFSGVFIEDGAITTKIGGPA
ncbi:hypothetical protein QBC35DRAFT_472591 [Podospora australis]|uniref:Glycoside hydrolase 131 catalytic N-terminal domain-containing protein n=1 Tax=Podospora australis TaxID=1536484 RepID=A0AAN6X105_9PEZI|nr:hypothetical protein QBC35DRAFT_472591 [Podospora australis]